MRRNKLLAEWFWSDRWMGSSAFLLPLEERGLYREMLTQAWRRGARLPKDHESIRRAVGATEAEWTRCWPKVEPYWRVDGDSIVNDTQLEVYAKALAIHADRSRAGRLGNEARWGSQTASQTASQSDGVASRTAPTLRVAKGVAKGSDPSPDPDPSQDPISGSGSNGQQPALVELKLDGEQEQPPITTPPYRDEVEAARAVFDYWREKTNHWKSQWTKDREAKLKVRLREEPGHLEQKVAGLKRAVDGALIDPVFNGSEKGRPYLEFENLFVHQGRNRIETLQASADRGPVERKDTRAQGKDDVARAFFRGAAR